MLNDNLEWCSPSKNKHHSFHVLGNRNLAKINAKGSLFNANAKINTLEKIRQVFEMRKNGMFVKDIAAEFNVNISTVQRILNKKSFKDVFVR